MNASIELSIVVPAFNEEGNLEKLYTEISKVLNKQLSYEVIFVDDGSSDRTWDIINNLNHKDKRVTGLRFSRNFGHQYALFAGLSVSNGDAVITMDADLQHPPEKIPGLINAIKKGADIAIGSRYVEGGSLGKWTIGRKIVSKGASALANILFYEIKDIKDKESGFFTFKKEVIKDVKLRPKGYKILLEIRTKGQQHAC